MRNTLFGLLAFLAALLFFVAAHAAVVYPAANVKERVRVPSVDVNKPIALPVLAKPVPDRAALDDVTTDAANAAQPSGTMPPRTQPAPFLKLTLPDPYENRRPLLPTPELSEEVPNSPPRLPGR